MKISAIITCSFLITPLIFGGIEHIDPSRNVIKQFQNFHEYTSSSFTGSPDITSLKKENRFFIAKIDCGYNKDKYYFFQTNDDAKELVRKVEDGAGWGLHWYYYDKEEISQSSPKDHVVIDIDEMD